jgi:GNAT superfamily N-acetyltransferase
MEDITFRDLAPGDAGWVAQRHAELYARDEGFDGRFEAVVLALLARFVGERGPGERAWIAVDAAGVRQGCVFCTRPEPDAAQLRLFLVEPALRGTGLGPALLERVIGHARSTGARRLILWTHDRHRAAGRLYGRRGFRLVAERPVDSFGQKMIEQHWVLDL